MTEHGVFSPGKLDIFTHPFGARQGVEPDFPFHIARYRQPDYPEHSHNAYEFFLVLAGSGTHRRNGHDDPIRVGDLVFIDRGIGHSFTEAPGEELEILNCIFLPELFGPGGNGNLPFLEPFFVVRNKIELDDVNAAHLRKALLELLAEYEGRQPNYRRVIPFLLGYAMELVLRLYLPVRDDTRAKVPDLLPRILSCVNEGYLGRMDLELLSRRFGLSRQYLSSLFSRFLGIGFKAYLSAKRIEYAKALLVSGKTNITEACFESGFNDLGSFERAFRKREGYGPREWSRHIGG